MYLLHMAQSLSPSFQFLNVIGTLNITTVLRIIPKLIKLCRLHYSCCVCVCYGYIYVLLISLNSLASFGCCIGVAIFTIALPNLLSYLACI